MNTPLRHLSVFALVLIAVLIGATTYWQTWAQADLAARKDNAVQIIQRLTVDRGKIFAADGTVLADNRVTASTASRSSRGATRRTTWPRRSSATRPRPASRRGSSSRSTTTSPARTRT